MKKIISPQENLENSKKFLVDRELIILDVQC